MTTKSFFNLIIFASTLLVLAILSINLSTHNYNFENRGALFFKNFTKNINDIDLISIESFENTIDLVKDDNKYIAKSGYPLKKGMWENLVTSLSLLRIEERKTNDPERHSELNLLSPELNKSEYESEGYGTKITLTKKNRSIFSSILFGKTDPSVGGLSGGQFVRMPDSDQTYLLKGAIRMPTSKSDWFESLLFTIGNDQFKEATLKNKSGIFKIENLKNSLELTFPKTLSFKVDKTKLSDVREVINGFYFYDVRKSIKKHSDNLPTITFETKNGLRLSISSISYEKDGESWIIIKTKSNNSASKKMAQEIQDKTIGYEFLANINTSDILRWDIKSLEAKAK